MRTGFSCLLAFFLACGTQAGWAAGVSAGSSKSGSKVSGSPSIVPSLSLGASPAVLPELSVPGAGLSAAGLPGIGAPAPVIDLDASLSDAALGLAPELALPIPVITPAPAETLPAVAPARTPLEVLKQAESLGVGAARSEDRPEHGYGANAAVFDQKAFAPAVDVSGAQPEGSVPGVLDWLGRLTRSPDSQGSGSDPLHFRKVLVQVFKSLKEGPVAEPLAKAKAAYSRGDAAVIARSQSAIRDRLLAAGKSVLAGKGLNPSSVISNGTTLDRLFGMIFSGGIEATSSYSGMSGESAEFWGVQGLDGGSSYGGTRAAGRRVPGVLIIINNPSDPIKVRQGEVLSRQPRVDGDFLAAVVSDGVDTVVLDAAALKRLAASSERWKQSVKRQAYDQGRMGPFMDWQAWSEKLSPEKR
ncbi:MAG: hypothetical protein HZB91_04240 [Elusimicrobia bacterium]|nr:hypothetical protein [Elusimicrobiota bacterium]